MFKLMGKEINAILGAQTILILTYELLAVCSKAVVLLLLTFCLLLLPLWESVIVNSE